MTVREELHRINQFLAGKSWRAKSAKGDSTFARKQKNERSARRKAKTAERVRLWKRRNRKKVADYMRPYMATRRASIHAGLMANSVT